MKHLAGGSYRQTGDKVERVEQMGKPDKKHVASAALKAAAAAQAATTAEGEAAPQASTESEPADAVASSARKRRTTQE